ncbi:MAG: VOC family protein [Dehalococcoidales bacterium]|nr:VOC family protein [Dehalococcoidales bacterium]
MENNWKFLHVGVITRDLDKTVDYFLSIGGHTTSDVINSENEFRSLKIRMVDLGPITLEIIQHVSGKCVQLDFLEKVGEGINHFAYIVQDLNKEAEKMLAQGATIINGRRDDEGYGFAYFAPNDAGANVIVELIQRAEANS